MSKWRGIKSISFKEKIPPRQSSRTRKFNGRRGELGRLGGSTENAGAFRAPRRQTTIFPDVKNLDEPKSEKKSLRKCNPIRNYIVEAAQYDRGKIEKKWTSRNNSTPITNNETMKISRRVSRKKCQGMCLYVCQTKRERREKEHTVDVRAQRLKSHFGLRFIRCSLNVYDISRRRKRWESKRPFEDGGKMWRRAANLRGEGGRGGGW